MAFDSTDDEDLASDLQQRALSSCLKVVAELRDFQKLRVLRIWEDLSDFDSPIVFKNQLCSHRIRLKREFTEMDATLADFLRSNKDLCQYHLDFAKIRLLY